MLLNKFSKAARGKSNKACENAASISKMPISNKSLSEIFNTKVTNTLKTYSSSTEKKSYEMFLFYASEEWCFHGKDRDITVWCCSG